MSTQSSTKNPEISLDFETRTYTIHVGSPATILTLSHQLLISLASKSNFFHTHLTLNTPIYDLQHIDLHTFGLYLTFATGGSFTDYDSYIVVAPKSSSSSSDNENNKEELKIQLTTQWTQLAQAYILGHDLSSPSFRNAAIDALITNTLTLHHDFDLIAGTGTDDIELVFSNTKKGDPLRRLILDTVVGLGSEDWEPRFERWWKVCFKEFLVEWGALAHRLCKKGDAGLLLEGDLRWRGRCAYHVHEGKAEDYCCADYWGVDEVADGNVSGL